MIDLELGPVVGQTGGGVEIITEEVSIGRSSSRSWELPEGWEEGCIGAEGTPRNHDGLSSPYVTMFGSEANADGSKASGFQSLASPAVISTGSRSSWSGTVTLIRTA